jgi:hypothetical protein
MQHILEMYTLHTCVMKLCNKLAPYSVLLPINIYYDKELLKPLSKVQSIVDFQHLFINILENMFHRY